jgi:hypothetical protein
MMMAAPFQHMQSARDVHDCPHVHLMPAAAPRPTVTARGCRFPSEGCSTWLLSLRMACHACDHNSHLPRPQGTPLKCCVPVTSCHTAPLCATCHRGQQA